MTGRREPTPARIAELARRRLRALNDTDGRLVGPSEASGAVVVDLDEARRRRRS